MSLLPWYIKFDNFSLLPLMFSIRQNSCGWLFESVSVWRVCAEHGVWTWQVFLTVKLPSGTTAGRGYVSVCVGSKLWTCALKDVVFFSYIYIYLWMRWCVFVCVCFSCWLGRFMPSVWKELSVWVTIRPFEEYYRSNSVQLQMDGHTI